METEPDFYIYQGEGNQDVLKTLRTCRTLGTILSAKQKILLVKIDPIIEENVLPAGAKRNLIGLTQRGRQPVEELSEGEITFAIVWEIYELAQSKYEALPHIGMGVIYKSKPKLDADGCVIPEPPKDILKQFRFE